MAIESTITKILFRRGPQEDLKLDENVTTDADGNVISTGSSVVLDLGEPGYVTDTNRLYVGDGNGNNIEIPKLHIEGGLEWNAETNGLALATNQTNQIRTSNDKSGCGVGQAAICADVGGIYSAADINCGGDIVSYCTSDENVKSNIKVISNPLDRLEHLSGVTFTWDDDKQDTYTGNDTGVIAQQVERTELPGLVQTRDNGLKAVKYERLVPLLIECIKQLNDKVESLSRLVNNESE